MTELLPCPFCGGAPGVGNGPGYHFVNCADCMSSADVLFGDSHGKTAEEAIAAWNRRAPVQASEARGAIGDDILGKLEDEKVFAIDVRGAMLHFYERCDEYFGVDLTTSEVRSLAAELTMLANKTDAMIAAHTQAGPVG